MLEEELKRWERFRDALRMDECQRYASAAGAGAFPSKTEAMLLIILSAYHETLKELLKQINRTEGSRPIPGTALR